MAINSSDDLDPYYSEFWADPDPAVDEPLPSAYNPTGQPPYTVNNPPPPPRDGYEYVLNPTTGEFVEVLRGTLPPWMTAPSTEEPPPTTPANTTDTTNTTGTIGTIGTTGSTGTSDGDYYAGA